MPDDDAGAKQAKTIKDLEDKLAALESDRDKWKDLSKKHEQRSQENLSAVEELKALKDSKQTDEEKLATKLADLEKRANAADHRALRAEIAQSKGLTAAQAKRLQGTNKEELEADADDLLESFPAAKDGNGKNGAGSESETERKQDRGDPGRRPKEKLRSGAVTDDDDKDDDFDPQKVADAVRRRSF